MDSRRDFLKKAGLLAGGMVIGTVPDSIRRALAIDPEPGSTYLDAEYIVILMQENRSFDHTFGCLQGVRGYRDPHPLELPNGNPVWLQSDEKAVTYTPFRLNMWESNSTWMDSLPHGWNNQTDARNGGRYDKWLPNKHNSIPAFSAMPLTLGYYNRIDIPFYYALADAFTVCDAAFCSSLTGTNPNRLHLWTGTVRARQDPSSKACILNEDVGYPTWVSWPTFPERLEGHGVSWKIYQNEIDLDSGFSDDENNWLGNFQDNPMEWFEQYNHPFRKTRRDHVDRLLNELPGQIEAVKQKLSGAAEADKPAIQKDLSDKEGQLSFYRAEAEKYGSAAWGRLSDREKSIHQRAFVTNDADPRFRELTELTYQDGDKQRTVKVPAGDVFHQFRQDVKSGELPTVSWLVAPESYSDHPSSAWYGAWYVSEALDILTQNPEVWKKTVFILCYDENDGYFDHYPPFVAPNPKDPTTGKTSPDIDTNVDYVELAEDLKHHAPDDARGSSIGLGFRVPLVIASPWSRGGVVNSETFDHTSILQFLEVFIANKTGRPIKEPNISQWRRAVCGDLTSAFRPYHGERIQLPKFLDRDEFVEAINRAQYKKLPDNFRGLTPAEIALAKTNPRASDWMPKQETGTRVACPLKYELYADSRLESGAVKVSLEAGEGVFGKESLSSPFNVYAYTGMDVLCRNYAATAGSRVEDAFPLDLFDGGAYRVRIDGPNGFYREFRGHADEPLISTELDYVGQRTRLNGNLKLTVKNLGSGAVTVALVDNAYGGQARKRVIGAGSSASFVVDTSRSHGWYDASLSVDGHPTLKRYAGHVETGNWSVTDPAMSS